VKDFPQKIITGNWREARNKERGKEKKTRMPDSS
jgi:hypothetical protein